MFLLFASVISIRRVLVPQDYLIQRGEDAFYCFKVALNYAQLGVLTFDGTLPTKGVQPLWAMLLIGLAVLSFLGTNLASAFR